MYDAERLKKQANYGEQKYWVCPANLENDVNQGLRARNVRIHDVTLRDGEQTSRLAFSISDRIRISEALDELGVARIEAGMPIISAENREGIQQVVKLNLNAEITALVRAHPTDISMAVDCGLKSVVVEHCINPYLIEQGYELDKQEVIDRCIKSISLAKENDLNVIFMGWDLTRCDDLDYVRDCYLAIADECMPDSFVLVDTFGVALPRAAAFLVKKISEWLPEVTIEYHNHNEFGLANAGVLEAVAAGASIVHTAINGLGERTGNAATEEIVAMLEMLAGVETGVNMEKIMDVSLLVENITNRYIPQNKPIVGPGLFDVETGVAVDLIRKMGKKGFDMPVSPFIPQAVGRLEGNLVLGKNSGRSTIEYFLEKHDIGASTEQIEEIVSRVKLEGRLQRALLSDVQFLSICEKVI